MIRMKPVLLLIFLTGIFSLNISAQSSENEDSDHHEHRQNEIGIANSPVYFLKEKEFAYGFHVHYVRNIPKSKFAIGLGYERIFDEHKHNTFGLEATYRPIEALTMNLSPGLTFEDNNPGAGLALHFETAYEIEMKDFHIGPALEFAYDPEDFHISLGIHIGYGF